jgi:hypothetical protein
MGRTRRQVDRSWVWPANAGYAAALLLVGGCGSHPVKALPTDGASDTAPMTKADVPDAGWARDQGASG